ncbi:MAG: CARDB domain-containing protein, partial [Candidatus Thermoplasmatota archaeon]
MNFTVSIVGGAIDPKDKPDLIVEQIIFDNSTVESLNIVKITSVVKNVGNNVADIVFLTFENNWLNETYVYGELVPGANTTFTHKWNVTGLVGEYDIRVVVDGQNLVNESDETNNQKNTTIVITKPPKIVVTSFYVREKNIIAVIKNLRDIDTPKLNLSIKHNDEYIHEFDRNFILKARYSTEFEFKFHNWTPKKGKNLLEIEVSHEGMVISNETYIYNYTEPQEPQKIFPDLDAIINRIFITCVVSFILVFIALALILLWVRRRKKVIPIIIITFLIPTLMMLNYTTTANPNSDHTVDVFIADLKFSSDDNEINVGDVVKIDATVRNNGTGNISNFDVYFYLNETLFLGAYNYSGENLTPSWGEKPEIHAIILWNTSNESLYTEIPYPIKAVVNVSGDSNISNNVLEKNITFKPKLMPMLPDLIVKDVSWYNITVKSQNIVVIISTITNIGKENASASSIKIYNRLFNTTICKKSLAIGEATRCVYFWNVTGLIGGAYPIRIIADAMNEVTEQNETNNEFLTTISFDKLP